MKKKFLVCILAAAAVLSVEGCHKKETKVSMIEYSDIMGSAEGTADFQSEDSPEINIKDIQSYVGQDIDYSSGINIKNVDNYDDFQMWVDATGVDIYTVGKYTVTYKFVFGGKTLEKTVSVTILEKEESGESIVTAGNSGNTGANVSDGSSAEKGSSGGSAQQNGGVDTAGNSDSGGNSDGGEISAENSAEIPSDSNGAEGNAQGSSQDGNVPGGNSPSRGNTSNGNTSNENTSNGNSGGTPHEIITSSQSGTKKPSTIGYTNIELLSGNYVKMKCTSARYIVSTRTDESQTVKNNKTYNVSKLIITLNTGEEQVLETVEKAVD